MPPASPNFSSVLVGSESLLIQCGEILLAKGHEIRAVATRNPQIVEWAQEQGIDALATGADLADGLRPLRFDYFFSITNLSMISAEILALARKASINFHDGPLPKYAGM